MIYISTNISGHKWSTTHRVLKSHRSKMSVIYMQSWKQCSLPVITTMALWQVMYLGTWCTYSIWYKLIHFSLLLNPTIQRMGNTPNILIKPHLTSIDLNRQFLIYTTSQLIVVGFLFSFTGSSSFKGLILYLKIP